jgi:hypothetical protein
MGSDPEGPVPGKSKMSARPGDLVKKSEEGSMLKATGGEVARRL